LAARFQAQRLNCAHDAMYVPGAAVAHRHRHQRVLAHQVGHIQRLAVSGEEVHAKVERPVQAFRSGEP